MSLPGYALASQYSYWHVRYLKSLKTLAIRNDVLKPPLLFCKGRCEKIEEMDQTERTGGLEKL